MAGTFMACLATPPHRAASSASFLRGYAMHAAPLKDVSDTIVLGTALLNNVFIPYGTVAPDPSQRMDRSEFTPFAVLKSPQEKKMLVRSYRNMQWRQIDLSKLDLTKAKTWPIEDGSLGITDITAGGSVVASAEEEPTSVAV